MNRLLIYFNYWESLLGAYFFYWVSVDYIYYRLIRSSSLYEIHFLISSACLLFHLLGSFFLYLFLLLRHSFFNLFSLFNQSLLLAHLLNFFLNLLRLSAPYFTTKILRLTHISLIKTLISPIKIFFLILSLALILLSFYILSSY